MDDGGGGAKKAGGILAAVLAGIGGFMAHGLDDCARIGARSASSFDDAARIGARSADDLAGFGGAGRYGDDLAYRSGRSGGAYGDDLGRAGAYGIAYGDDVSYGGARGARAGADDVPYGAARSAGDVRGGLAPSYGPGRTGGSFGGGRFGDEVASGASRAGDLGPTLTDDLAERAAELVVDATRDAIELALEGDGDEPSAIPVLDARFARVRLERARVLALAERAPAGAELAARSLRELDRLLAQGALGTVDLVVLPPETSPLRADADGTPRSDRAILVRAAQLGRRAILLVCDAPTPRCMEDAAAVARSAAAGGPSDLADRLAAARDASPSRSLIALRRLHASGARILLAGP